MQDIVRTMGNPTQLMRDGEGTFHSSEYMILENKHNINNEITVSSALHT